MMIFPVVCFVFSMALCSFETPSMVMGCVSAYYRTSSSEAGAGCIGSSCSLATFFISAPSFTLPHFILQDLELSDIDFIPFHHDCGYNEISN